MKVELTLEEIELLESCLSKHFFSVSGIPAVVVSCAEKLVEAKKMITKEGNNDTFNQN